MFSQLVFLRLRAAEKALREGRIDEAYRLATAPDLRTHSRGKAVLAALAERFLDRARNHYRSDKFTEALMDLDRADAGGVLKNEIDELRGYVRVVAAERDRRDESRRVRIHEAQKRIERGSVAAGRDMLEMAGTDQKAQAVLNDAAGRAKDAERAAEQAERLLKSGQRAEAAERIQKARSLDAHCEAAVRLEAELVRSAVESARSAVQDGNLSRAAGELACLGSTGAGTPSVQELAEVLRVAAQAGEALRRFDYADAHRQILLVARKVSKVRWADQAAQQLKQLSELHTAACAGPLGDRIDVAELDGARRRKSGGRTPRTGDPPVGRQAAAGPREARRLDETVVVPRAAGAATDGLADRYLLLVDGGGSYLLLRGGQASIGRAASNLPPDVPIVSDLAERHANITRVDDDYFIFSTKDVEVGGKRTQHGLLRDGDRVVLGKKAKFTFRMPSRKSATAVLELSDTTKAPNDVRRVILLDHHAIVANSPTAHIFCRHAGCSLVLFEKNGSLWIRAKSDGYVDTQARPLLPGEPVEIAGASLVLAPWKQPQRA